MVNAILACESLGYSLLFVDIRTFHILYVNNALIACDFLGYSILLIDIHICYNVLAFIHL